MSKPTDFDLISRLPVIHRRRIGWSDTDAAQIAYTVRFFEFAMAAIEAWFREVWGEDWFVMHTRQGMGSPFVRVETDILAPLVPGELLDVAVTVERLGNSSLTFAVDGRTVGRGEPVLRGRYVCALVRVGERMRAVPIPESKRQRIMQYIAACQRRQSVNDGGDGASTAQAPPCDPQVRHNGGGSAHGHGIETATTHQP